MTNRAGQNTQQAIHQTFKFSRFSQKSQCHSAVAPFTIPSCIVPGPGASGEVCVHPRASLTGQGAVEQGYYRARIYRLQFCPIICHRFVINAPANSRDDCPERGSGTGDNVPQGINALFSTIRYETSEDENNEYNHTLADVFMKVIQA